jgi:mono/diheme cytochrome c family protein
VPRQDYEAFIGKRASAAGAYELGHEEWVGVCQKCHRLDNRYVGPALNHNALLAQRRGLEVLLRGGRGMMPAVGKNWSGAQIDALIAYTKQFVPKGGGS